ncbi:MAG: hypothetical protein LBF01_04130, partial [Bacteroidales bacterium]|nr:hypothetical protein [Bacteroidales bacterium]
MRKSPFLIILSLLIFIAMRGIAQNIPQGVPQAMKYQAVLHDIAGNTLSNRTGISIRVNILEGSATGYVSYSEIHKNVSTNAFGVINLEIGKGIPANNAFSTVDWGI